MHKTVKQVLMGAGLVAGLATSAQAQYLTDAGSPLGGGGGASGSVANFSQSGQFLSYFGASTTVANPLGGGRIAVNEAAQNGFVEAIARGAPGSLAPSLGGSAQAEAFAAAAAAFGNALRTNGNLPQAALALVDAFNALVDTPSASVEALATVRAGVMEVLQMPGRESASPRLPSSR